MIADQLHSLPNNLAITQTKLQTDDWIVSINILMGRQNSLMSIQIVMRVKQEKQGTIIFQTVVNWNKNTSASVQSDKQADDH